MEKEEKKEEGEGKPKLTDEQKAAIAKKIMEECKGKEGDEASKCSTEVTEAFMKELERAPEHEMHPAVIAGCAVGPFAGWARIGSFHKFAPQSFLAPSLITVLRGRVIDINFTPP